MRERLARIRTTLAFTTPVYPKLGCTGYCQKLELAWTAPSSFQHQSAIWSPTCYGWDSGKRVRRVRSARATDLRFVPFSAVFCVDDELQSIQYFMIDCCGNGRTHPLGLPRGLASLATINAEASAYVSLEEKIRLWVYEAGGCHSSGLRTPMAR